jgi:prolyl-tRNA synthetase
VADLLRKQVKSYRQLPVVVYQLQTKFRDEPRARGGLIRVREFVMKDAYSCHESFADLDRYYPSMYQAYFNVFRRAGIDVIVVESDVGMMGGTMAHEFIFLSEIGEDHLVLCDSCGYAANRQIARFRKEAATQGEPRALEEVATPDTKTIAGLAQLLSIPESHTAKAAFFMSGDRFVFAVVRGDMEVSETKLTNAVGATELRPARAEELTSHGIIAGYASPIGATGMTVVADELVARSPNLVAGANREGYHLLNTNVPRDYRPDIVADIAEAYESAPCERCGAPLRIVRGVEVGNLFKLGTKYSEGLGATFLDERGEQKYIVMGSYGIGVGRLMACIAEGCRDDRGLIWPVTVAPFDVYLVGLDLDDDAVRGSSDGLYDLLQQAGIDTLYDDRRERAGVKFNDAELLGMPLRLTVSRRTLEKDSVEVRPRNAETSEMVSLEAAIEDMETRLGEMRAKVLSRLKEEKFEG